MLEGGACAASMLHDPGPCVCCVHLMQAMSAMVQLELPHVNVLTKVDLLGEENKVPPY